MKVTMRQALDIYKVTTALMQLNTMPAKVSLGIARLSNLAETEARLFSHENAKLTEKYGVVTNHNNPENVPGFGTTLEPDSLEDTEEFKKETMAGWANEFNELLVQMSPDWDIEKIAIPEKALDGVSYTPLQLKAIEPFIEIV